MTRNVRFALLIAGLAFAPLAIAQRPEPLPAPALDVWSYGNVLASARLPDGRVVVGGDFRAIDGVPRERLALLAPDGTLDPTWDPGADATVRTLAITDDGAILVGGDFQSIAGQPIRHLAKLSPGDSGAADPAWRPDPNGPVGAIVSDTTGMLFVAGSFASIGGRAQRALAKLSATDARADPSWGSQFAPSYAYVSAIAYEAGTDRLYFAGSFTSVDGVARDQLARVAGSGTGALDAGWHASLGYDASSLVVGNGSVYAGGTDYLFSGYPFARFARFSAATGAADPAFAQVIANGPGHVHALALDARGLYVAGAFYATGAAQWRTLARFDALTGAVDPWFAPVDDAQAFHVALHAGAVHVATSHGYERRTSGGVLAASADAMVPGKVQALASLPDGSMIAGGDFDFAGAVPRSKLFKVAAGGALDAQWAPAYSRSVRRLAVDAAFGVVYALDDSGDLARFSTGGTGARDAAWNPDPGFVSALAVGLDGGVFVSGYLGRRGDLAKLSPVDGSVDPLWGGTGTNYVPRGLAVAPDGSVFVFGNFETVNGVARPRLAKLDPLVGAVDPDWDLGVLGDVGDVAFDGNTIYVGGRFTTIAGAADIVRLSVSSPSVADPSFATTLPQDWAVGNLALGDGAIFAYYSTDPRGYVPFRLAKLDANGVVDPQWTPDVAGYVHAMRVNAAGELVVGGEFQQVGAQTRRGIAALPAALFPAGTLFADGFD